jgi:hypothetical protein
MQVVDVECFKGKLVVQPGSKLEIGGELSCRSVQAPLVRAERIEGVSSIETNKLSAQELESKAVECETLAVSQRIDMGGAPLTGLSFLQMAPESTAHLETLECQEIKTRLIQADKVQARQVECGSMTCSTVRPASGKLVVHGAIESPEGKRLQVGPVKQRLPTRGGALVQALKFSASARPFSPCDSPILVGIIDASLWPVENRQEGVVRVVLVQQKALQVTPESFTSQTLVCKQNERVLGSWEIGIMEQTRTPCACVAFESLATHSLVFEVVSNGPSGTKYVQGEWSVVLEMIPV